MLSQAFSFKQTQPVVEQTTAKYSKDRSLSDASMKLGTYTRQIPLFPKITLATQNSKMAAPKIQDVRPKTCFFLYNSKCIDFKPHKCIEVEYKVGHYGNFGTKYMSVSITVLEIQHTGTFMQTRESKAFLTLTPMGNLHCYRVNVNTQPGQTGDITPVQLSMEFSVSSSRYTNAILAFRCSII